MTYSLGVFLFPLPYHVSHNPLPQSVFICLAFYLTGLPVPTSTFWVSFFFFQGETLVAVLHLPNSIIVDTEHILRTPIKKGSWKGPDF